MLLTYFISQLKQRICERQFIYLHGYTLILPQDTIIVFFSLEPPSVSIYLLF